MKRTLTLLALALMAGAGIAGVTGFSSATFVSSTSSTSSVSGANDWTPPTVSIASPGATVRGTVTVTATAADERSGIASVQVQVRAAGATPWTTICTDSTSPFSCSWNTTGLTDGAYDLRAIATDQAGYTATSAEVRTTVVNTATITLADPGAVVSGSVNLQATIGSGTGWSVRFERAPIGTTTWTSICTNVASPYTCSWNTTATPYGHYDLRAVATLGSTTITSPVVVDTLVDNTVRSITLADPGTYLEGTVNLTATATSTATIASVAFQRSPAGAGTWTTICTDTAAPWACAWVTNGTGGAADGSYDLRAVLTDVNGATATSNLMTGRKVDNVTTPLKALDVQTVTAGNPNRIDAGDKVLLTYSRQVDLTTITPGWDGSAVPISVTIVRNFFSTDDLTFSRAGSSLNLGAVQTDNNYAAIIGLVNPRLDATMTATTETVDGIPRTVVTVEMGNLVTGTLRTVSRDTLLTWIPSTQVFGLNGSRLPATSAVESGPSDKDF
ncbi:Ig-like domain-containing protein [Aeromicrobium sp. Sec7.5]|uniref:Ig-like domain-containing protein n=1 Tax=Aeromicrobium sp. Sec7.5 TaxID=3121276 RepID=UPI002FE4ED43